MIPLTCRQVQDCFINEFRCIRTYGRDLFGQIFGTVPHVQAVVNSQILISAFVWVCEVRNHFISKYLNEHIICLYSDILSDDHLLKRAAIWT